MTIVYSADEYFVQHFLVSLTSVLHTNNCDKLEIYLLHKDISDKSMSLINHNIAEFPVRVHFIRVNMSQYKNLMVSAHISVDAYFRLSIPDLSPDHIERVIYLDCDTIITTSLEPLWQLNLRNKAFAAVPDMDNIRNIEMGLGNSPTFNSGVMVIDVKKWRLEGISKKLFKFLFEFPEKIKFHDQDALNEVLINQILELPVKWNLTTPYIRVMQGKKKPLYNVMDLPAIIHFNGVLKPWHFKLRHPFKNYYYRYLKLTPFRDFIPNDKNLNTILRKYLANFFIFWGLKRN